MLLEGFGWILIFLKFCGKFGVALIVEDIVDIVEMDMGTVDMGISVPCKMFTGFPCKVCNSVGTVCGAR